MAKRLTRYILIALVLGLIAGWAINAAIDDGTPTSAAHLKSIVTEAQEIVLNALGSTGKSS